MRTMWIAWALTLGLALTVSAGLGALVATTYAPAAPQADEGGLETATGDETLAHDDGSITVGLVVRWGYLDATVAHLVGHWRFNEAGTGGEFRGGWRIPDGAQGTVQGSFTLPEDGMGTFGGTWAVAESERGGSLAGEWVRTEPGHGFFSGQWAFADGGPGGAMGGKWAQLVDEGGGFLGVMIDRPTIDPVSWDGFLQVSEGVVRLVKPLRWEPYGHPELGAADTVLPRENPQTAAWESSTTVDWDGLVFALRLPRSDPAPTVTVQTAQASFTFAATELADLHVREAVDEAGHEIEVRGFAVERILDREVARFHVALRWGMLTAEGADGEAETTTTWDGFAQLTDGALAVANVLSFERGDTVLPRDNRQTVEWRSRTTTGWDGIVLVAYVPLDKVEEAHFTIHAGAFSHVFALTELPGDHAFDLDGSQVEVRAERV